MGSNSTFGAFLDPVADKVKSKLYLAYAYGIL